MKGACIERNYVWLQNSNWKLIFAWNEIMLDFKIIIDNFHSEARTLNKDNENFIQSISSKI